MKQTDYWGVDNFFYGRPEAQGLFDSIDQFIKSLGSITMQVVKTQISYADGYKFAWIWLPQTWTKKRPETSITLTFFLDRRIDDKRITEVVEPRPGKWIHHIVIQKDTDFDDIVKGWIKEAHKLAGRNKGNKKI